MIVFTCPSCQKKLSVQEDAVGRKVTCPVCGQSMQSPKGWPLVAAGLATALVVAAVVVLGLAGWLPGRVAEKPDGEQPKEKLPAREEKKPENEKPSVKDKGKKPGLDSAGFINAVGMKMVRIPAGRFTMGSPRTEQGRADDEEQHEVEISEFYLSAYEVTQKQFRAVMGYNPSFFSNNAKGKGWYAVQPGGGKSSVTGLDTEEHPVENISWHEANEFCRKLMQLDKQHPAEWVYRLPREAEWEYACRGGASSYQTFHFGNSLSSSQANIFGRFPYGGAPAGVVLGRPSKVGSYKPNAFGLYDMHGNVWEWCHDWYAEDYYARSPRKDPVGPPEGVGRVIRGGSRAYGAVECRSARRIGRYGPTSRYNGIGFRPALVPSGNK